MNLKPFIERIVNEIGPRPACTGNEARAGEIISEEFRNRGAEVVFHESVARPNAIHGLINLMTALFGTSLLLYLFYPPAASVLITATLAALYINRAVGSRVLDWAFRAGTTRSVIGTYKPGGGVRRVLIFSGHHDSPNMMPLFYSSLKARVGLIENAATLGAVLLIPAGILRAMGAGHGLWVDWRFHWFDAFFLCAAAGFGVLLFFRSRMLSDERNPGANDNLSAVAVLVGLAEHLKGRGLMHTEVKLISFGAEEPGLYGSHKFARGNRDLVGKAVTVNMETVGAGKLAVISKEKNSRIKYSPEVVDLISRAGSRLGIHVPPVAIGYGATDSASIVKEGGKSACLFGMDETGLFSLWHSPDDRPDNISEESLQNALRICIEIINMTEKNAERQTAG